MKSLWRLKALSRVKLSHFQTLPCPIYSPASYVLLSAHKCLEGALDACKMLGA